jgi:hypothetical protein
MSRHDLEARGIRLRFEPEGGLLCDLAIEDRGRTVAPLHRAPWVDSGEDLPEGLPPHLARLQGDFFCAPFAASEGASPMHGWPANGTWQVLLRERGLLRAVLDRPVQGATMLKELRVVDGHPFVYQRHLLMGGEGRLSVANHANLSLPTGGIIRTSPKLWWETPGTPQESDPTRGRSALRYPARAEDPQAFPGAEGPVDLLRYPWASRHEDFVMALEAPGHRLGWTAVARPAEGDLYLSLRDARRLPMTMLWHSDGGRDYPPWSGRNRGCLGVEEGAASHMRALGSEEDLAGPGQLALSPDGVADVRHAIGAIAWPSGKPVAEVLYKDGSILVRGEDGAERRLDFRPGFLT